MKLTIMLLVAFYATAVFIVGLALLLVASGGAFLILAPVGFALELRDRVARWRVKI